jgi:LysR family hydrogen peroxide-inducible transcriptional activator
MDFAAPLPVSLRQLQYLVAVADLGGFRKAADACHVSQPSLSAQIAQVEDALGVQVFERNRRQVRVSAAGTPIVAQARAVLVAAGDLTELGRHLADPFTGTLRLGVIPTISPYLLPEIAPGLARTYPRLTIVWREDHTRGLVRQVNDGTLDAAMLALEADLGTLEHAMLMRDPFLPRPNTGWPVRRGARASRIWTTKACCCSTTATASAIRRCSSAPASARAKPATAPRVSRHSCRWRVPAAA